jgi:tyrosine-protein phosphatase SIW14
MRFGLSLCFLLTLALPAVAYRGLPPQESIGNFGKIDERLYRGAQPDASGLKSLKRLGVKTIINLRMANDVWQAEETEAQANGITYINLPMRGLGRPTDEQVRQALSMIDTLPAPIFIHCKHGCDRTGTVVACYRIAHDKWSGESALREAVQYGMSKLERGMKQLITEFAKALAH